MKFYLRSLRRSAEVFLLIASFVYVVSFFIVAFSRISYPYDLEWLEGGVACNVLRLLENKPLYTAPSSEFFSFAHTPLYYYLVWGVSLFFGLHYWVGRLISVIAFICIGLLLSRIIYRQTSSWFLCLTIPGVFFASFHYAGSFFDLFHVDSTAYAFALGSFYVCWFCPSNKGVILGAVLLCAAIFTKQTITLFIPFGVLFMIARGRRPAATFGLTCLAIIVAGVLFLNVRSNGWFYEMCINKSLGVGFNLLAGIRYVFNNLLLNVPLIFFGVFCWIVCVLAGIRQVRSKCLCSPWIWLFTAGLLVFLLARSGYSGWSNDSIPMIIFGFLFVGLFWGDVRRGDRTGEKLLDWLLLVVTGLQFVLFIYSPMAEIPSMADREAGDRFMEILGRYDGEVLVMYHPYYPVLLGKKPSFHADELFFYYMQGGRDPEKAELPEDLLGRIRGKYYAAIVLDQERGLERQLTGTELVEIPKLRRLIEEHYLLAERLFEKDDPVFWPRTGWGVRPDFIYLPRETEQK